MANTSSFLIMPMDRKDSAEYSVTGNVVRVKQRTPGGAIYAMLSGKFKALDSQPKIGTDGALIADPDYDSLFIDGQINGRAVRVAYYDGLEIPSTDKRQVNKDNLGFEEGTVEQGATLNLLPSDEDLIFEIFIDGVAVTPETAARKLGGLYYKDDVILASMFGTTPDDVTTPKNEAATPAAAPKKDSGSGVGTIAMIIGGLWLAKKLFKL